MIDLKEYDLIEIYILFAREVFQLNMSMDLFLGMFYLGCHQLYVIFIIINICVTTNINHLFMLLIIVSLNLTSNIILRTCPIYLMEEKYINTSLFRSTMKMCGISFNSDKQKIKYKKHFTKYLPYCIDECTFQLISIVYLLVVLKILLLLIIL
jgi:TM2 domain-containing membrane protein YozV